MKYKLFNIILLFISLNVFSQNYNIKHYTVKDGLLHAFVNDIIQDSRGDIWIATGGGLCKFNGVEFSNYTTKDGLNYYRLLCLAEDNLNNIWVGTSKGINVYNGDSIFSTDKVEGNILAFEKSHDNKMWVITTKGINKVEFINGEFYVTKFNHEIEDANSTNIFQDRDNSLFLIEDKNNKLFVGYNNNVYLYQGNKVEQISKQKGLEIYSASKVQNKIIFGTNKGLFQYKNNKLIQIENNNLDNFKVFKIKNKDDKLWMIGQWSNTAQDELFLVSIRLNNDKYFRKISVSNGLIDNPTSIFIDHENNIWTGSNGGLSVLKGESFVNYTKENGIVGNKIWGIHQGLDNKIWVGTINEGLSIIDKNSIQNYTIENGLPDGYVGAIFQDSKSKTYIGTANKGLCIANTINDKLIFSQPTISLNKGKTRVDCIIKDKNNIIWVASNKGLYYSIDNLHFYHKPLFTNDTGQVTVQKILLSKANKLYIGTKSDGLFLFDSEEITPINSDKINTVGVTSICEDSENNIWIGSQSKGILNISDTNNTWITEKDGLKSNLIYILQADKNGNVWIGSNLGLDKLDAKNYHKTKQINIQHYDTDDGLHELEMNLNGSIEDNEGNLWFATNNGVLKYDYRYDISNRIPPITNLLNIKLHSQNVDWQKYTDTLSAWNHIPINPVLPYNQNHITFNFVGISYKNPKKIKYSWKLEGFDKNWVPSSPNRQVTYSNLPSGKYTFKLKSSNNDGVWNEKNLEFNFKIKRPFWEQWWFVSLSILFVILIIYTFVKWRIIALQRRQKELKLLVNIRTKEISLQKEELQSQRDAIFQQKEQIENIHLHLSDSIRYAKRIQDSILPNNKLLEDKFSDSFILFKPKDNVSGDFYWWANVEGNTVITAADCTGHGVPGAFMSLLGVSYLREIVQKEYITHTGVILRKLRKEVINALKQKGRIGEQKDGMDMALISINHETNICQFSGANNPLYLVRSGELTEYKGDKMPIAIYQRMDNYVTHEIQLQKGDCLYMFSDGFPDQFGGEKRKKFKYKRFKNLIIENSNKPMLEQKELLNLAFEDWKSDLEQIDDVVVLGIEI